MGHIQLATLDLLKELLKEDIGRNIFVKWHQMQQIWTCSIQTTKSAIKDKTRSTDL